VLFFSILREKTCNKIEKMIQNYFIKIFFFLFMTLIELKWKIFKIIEETGGIKAILLRPFFRQLAFSHNIDIDE